MVVLGIETSCDETAVAIVRDGKEILANVICSQIDLHARFGGIVPEVASRKHVELINPALREALNESGLAWKDIDGVAVTHGPGLVGSLLVGVAAAKALAYVFGLPIIAINHLEAHIYANFLVYSIDEFPVLNLIVSGGHSDLILMTGHEDSTANSKYRRIGRTRDDAAGEAFDKVARALGLGFPGGPEIDRLSREGNDHAVDFPQADLGDSFDFSFSGLKTAVFRWLHGHDALQQHISKADIAASFQRAVVDSLVDTTFAAAEKYAVNTVALAGGVAANHALRTAMRLRAQQQNLRLLIPPLLICTDNAAMVACAGCYRLKQGEESGFEFDTHARLPLAT